MLKWILVAMVVFWFFQWRNRSPRLTHLVSPEHLMEISGGLGRALSVAVEYIGRPSAPDSFAVGSAFMTSAQVAIFYSIAKASGGGFEHHISIAHQRKPLSKEIAAFFGAAINRMLLLIGKQGVLAQSKTGTFYFIVPFSATDHQALVSRGIDRLDENVARQRFELAMEDREYFLKNLGKIDVKERKT